MRNSIIIIQNPDTSYSYKCYYYGEPLEVTVKPGDPTYEVIDAAYLLQDDMPKTEKAILKDERAKLQQEKLALTDLNKTLEAKLREKDQAIIDLISNGTAKATDKLINMYPEIFLGGSIEAGDVMRYKGHLYMARKDITNVTADDLPDGKKGLLLWRGGLIPKIENPKHTDDGPKYRAGDHMDYMGVEYVCLQDTDKDPGEAPYPVWDLASNHDD